MTKKEILVVEDEVIIGMEIEDRLKELGYYVLGVVSTGAAAIETAARSQPDLILMDVMLKGDLDGIETAEQIRTESDIPIIYLTAYADNNTVERAKVTEPFGYLVKPFEERELHTTIEMAFYKHRMEKRLRESEQWLNTVLRSIGEAVIATDKKGRITFMNPVAEAITHWQQADALGQAFDQVVHIVDEEANQSVKNPVVAALQEARPVNLNDITILARDDFYKPIDASAAPIKDDHGQTTGMVLVFRDITDRKEAELALQSSVQQMKTAYEQATIYAHELKEEITERKQAQETLQESQARLDGIISTARDAIITIDAGQRIILFNSAAEQMFGYKAPEVMGRSLEILLPERFRRTHVHQVDQFIKTGATARALGIPGELRGQRADGETFPIEAMISKVKVSGQVLCTTIIRDITERKQLEERLKAIYQLGQELPLVRDELSIVQRVLETAIHVLEFEVACCGLVYETTGQLDYHFRSTVSRPEEGHLHLPLDAEQSIGVRVVHRGQAINVPDTQKEAGYVALPGKPPIRSELCVPMKVAQRIIGVLNVESTKVNRFAADDQQLLQALANRTAVAIENARLHKKEREQFRRLQQSQAQLVQVEKMAALGRLVASIAHEINNPLQAIQNCFVLIEEELADLRRPEKLNLYTGVAKSEINRISTIVRRMRDFYRPTQQEPPAPSPDTDSLEHFYHLSPQELQTVNLHAILENVLQLAGKQLQHSGVLVERSWSDDLPQIQASPDHLKQVFLNLVLNAIDAMTAQGGELHLLTELAQTVSTNGKEQPFARIEFRDTGKGMSPEVLCRLFEPLFTTKEHGSGFGLFTSYKIIEAHHGRITAQSRPGKGTTFTILLPIKQP
jgi:PAS domain S-box-containing protein